MTTPEDPLRSRLLALLGPSHPHDEGRECGTCAAYNLLVAAPPVAGAEVPDHNHPYDSLCLVSECPLGAWRAALRSAAPALEQKPGRWAFLDTETGDWIEVKRGVLGACGAYSCRISLPPLRSAAPALDVERLRDAIYAVSVRHDWANTTDTEDRTEEIAREYATLEGASGE